MRTGRQSGSQGPVLQEESVPTTSLKVDPHQRRRQGLLQVRQKYRHKSKQWWTTSMTRLLERALKPHCHIDLLPCLHKWQVSRFGCDAWSHILTPTHTHVHTQRYMYHVRAHVLYKSSWFPRPTIRQLRQPYDNYTTTHTTTYTTTHIHWGKQWFVWLHIIEKLYLYSF